MVVVEGDVYCSDTDSDDDDVDRYVFLARQPAPPAGRHAEDGDRGGSSESDDHDGDATEDDEEEPERVLGMRRKKKPLREISDDDVPPPPPPKKPRVVELTAPPFVRAQLSGGSGSETESDSAAPLPFGAQAGESGSDGSHEKAHGHPVPGKKKRGVFGKRRRGQGYEEDGDRESHGAVAAAAAAKIATKSGALPPTVTSGRFVCPQCERCFDNHQALGGHVLGHRKKEKIAIAAAAAAASLYLDDAGGAANYKEESAVAEVNEDEQTANGSALADTMGVVAARRGKGNGGGGHGKIKTVDFVAEHREEEVDDEHANGNPGFGNKGNGKKVAVGTCHEGANGDGNVMSRTMYKCKVCGAECTTGRALGGHMRKHRKRPPPGGEEGRSPSPPTDDDYQITLARLFGAENKIGLV